jgi:predicted aspartyl protease
MYTNNTQMQTAKVLRMKNASQVVRQTFRRKGANNRIATFVVDTGFVAECRTELI